MPPYAQRDKDWVDFDDETPTHEGWYVCVEDIGDDCGMFLINTVLHFDGQSWRRLSPTHLGGTYGISQRSREGFPTPDSAEEWSKSHDYEMGYRGKSEPA